ncbi:MAG: hypothetical protein NTY02_10055 [Acidobacteria bacterium]|nr:hypothetical protein [Acidobacteriota bacterium]
MSPSEIYNLLVATVQGVGVSAVVVLVLFIGMSVVVGFVKLRPSGPKTMTVRSLEEALGQPVVYLPPSTPRGTTDQLGNSQRAA